MIYNPGAVRTFNYPTDRSGVTTPLDRAPVAATAHAWRDVVALAANGNQLAQKIVAYGRAENAKKLAAAEGAPVPTWAQEILAPLDEPETENLADVLSALSRAIA